MRRPGTSWVAGVATALGVLMIWGVSTCRQSHQTDVLAREALSHRWDTARICLLGLDAPQRGQGARGQAASVLQAHLQGLSSSEGHLSDIESELAWPQRCEVHYDGLYPFPGLLEEDPQPWIDRLPRSGTSSNPVDSNLADLGEVIAALDRMLPESND